MVVRVFEGGQGEGGSGSCWREEKEGGGGNTWWFKTEPGCLAQPSHIARPAGDFLRAIHPHAHPGAYFPHAVRVTSQLVTALKKDGDEHCKSSGSKWQQCVHSKSQAQSSATQATRKPTQIHAFR